jgi:hypothetical protein
MGGRWYGGVFAAHTPGRSTQGSTGSGGGARPAAPGASQRARRWRKPCIARSGRGGRWRLAETSRTGTGPWYSLSGAVAQHGPPLAWLLTAPRAPEVVRRLLQKASRRPGRHETLPIDGSDATDAASKRSHEAPGPASAIRPGQDGKQVVAQEQRAGQRVPRPRGGYIRCGRPGHVRWSRPHAHDQEPTAGG